MDDHDRVVIVEGVNHVVLSATTCDPDTGRWAVMVHDTIGLSGGDNPHPDRRSCSGWRGNIWAAGYGSTGAVVTPDR
ncbi:hypothetical protein ACFSSC_02245 [Corynebacterium mendelii]|uniref:Uncharacterized protein n=1 Tax=Corynebacterium mendelii TaxID=2765362 RepID=A0A939E1J1_9CORY|nr:hypothetical protein [Corynebacterium mendelii]MBN9644103.1 hypothetical protein [Corynebacterium mendelii]